MTKNTPARKSQETNTTPTAAVAQVKALRAEESEFLSMAQSNEIEAMVRAYRIGRIIDTEVDTRYGKSGVNKFAAEVGISPQTAYNYIYLARGAYQEDIIRQNPEVNRKYYQLVGRRINAFEDFLGLSLSAELVLNPLWKDAQSAEKVPDAETVEEIAKLLDSTRKHIRTDLKVGYILSEEFDVEVADGKLHYRLPTRNGNEAAEQKAMVEIGLMRERVSKLMGHPPFSLDMTAYDVSIKTVVAMAGAESGRTAKGIIREARRHRKIRDGLEQQTPDIGKTVDDRVLQGRSEVVLRDRTRFPERMVDVVITDPPYSQEYYSAYRPEGLVDHDAERTTGKQAHLVGRVADLLVSRKIIKEQFMWFSFCPIDYVHVFLPPILKAFRRLPHKHQVLVWDKQRVPKVGGDCLFGRQAEAILYISVNRPLGTVGQNGQTTPLHSSLFSCRAEDQDGNNFFWKPITLLKRLISLSTYDLQTEEAKRQVILDPFAGAGSTGAAAIECNRDFRLIESHAQQYATAKASVIEALTHHLPTS